MERLMQGLGNNSSREYNQIYLEREKKEVNWQDQRRWQELVKHYQGGPLCDVGCLDSLVLPLARKKYPFDFMLGIDTAAEAIKKMAIKYPSIYYREWNIFNFDVTASCFQYVVLGEVIEHLEEPEMAIAEAMRVLRSGGVLALSTPLEEAREIGAVDRSRHIWSFSEKDIKDMLGRYGRVKSKILRSQWWPRYRYCWPQIVAWCWKN